MAGQRRVEPEGPGVPAQAGMEGHGEGEGAVRGYGAEEIEDKEKS